MPTVEELKCLIDGCDNPKFSKGWCSKHYTRWKRHGDPLVITRSSPLAADATSKYCPRCETMKPLDQFDRRRSSKNGTLKGYCRDCGKTYDLEYSATPDGREAKRMAKSTWNGKNHDYFLRWRYGIDGTEYDAMLAAQDGRCAICQANTPGKTNKVWSVDHDHATGAVRGLLCSHCNTGLGYFKDDVGRLRSAAAYLERHISA